MGKTIIKRSPLFYVGDKYKLMPQLLKLFPRKINNYYEPFLGGGTVFLNVSANKYFLNDIDTHLISLHKFLRAQSSSNLFFKKIENVITQHNFSRSYKEDIIPISLKHENKKTYFARYNKNAYEKLRALYNESNKKSPLVLYILLIYGFNRMLRFNKSGKYNIPVGNVDLNANVIQALRDYFIFVKKRRVHYFNQDFRKFMRAKFGLGDFVYIDPPYLITFSEYNKLWSKNNEAELLRLIDKLDRKGVKFALSNVTRYKGKTNDKLLKWMTKYHTHKIRSNYISYHNNSVKNIEEVLITNYES